MLGKGVLKKEIGSCTNGRLSLTTPKGSGQKWIAKVRIRGWLGIIIQSHFRIIFARITQDPGHIFAPESDFASEVPYLSVLKSWHICFLPDSDVQLLRICEDVMTPRKDDKVNKCHVSPSRRPFFQGDIKWSHIILPENSPVVILNQLTPQTISTCQLSTTLSLHTWIMTL